MKLYFIIVLTLSLSRLLYSQQNDNDLSNDFKGPGEYTIKGNPEVIEIPFEFSSGKIVFDASMNGKTFKFTIDNGVLWSELLFFGSEEVDSLNIICDEEVLVTGPGEGSGIQSFTASDVSISFPGIDFVKQPAIITSKEQGFAEFFPGILGQVCGAFFMHFIVEFNFDENIIKLHNPQNYNYSGPGRRLNMKRDSSAAYSIPMKTLQEGCKETETDIFIDLGGIHYLRLMVNENNNFCKPQNPVKHSLGFGASGEIFGYMGELKKVSIAGYELNNVQAVFSESELINAPTQQTIGLPLLRCFNLIFDYFNKVIYLEPNKQFEAYKQ